MASRQYFTNMHAIVFFIIFNLCLIFFIKKYFSLPQPCPKPALNISQIYLNHSKEIIISKVYLAKKNFKTCMDEAAFFHRDDGFKFYDQYALCMDKYTSVDEKYMDVVYNGLSGEKKVYLPLAADYPQDRCNFMTIGIGGNTVAEKFFKQKYPKCKFYGIEPGKAADFADFGKVIPYGVGLEDSETEIIVSKTGGYKLGKTKVLSLTNILDNETGSRLHHYLSIDAEGYEYIILSGLVGNGTFAGSNITFCQIDVELHNPTYELGHPAVKTLNSADWQKAFLQESSPYIPIYKIPYGTHQKITYFNIQSPECEKAFKYSKFLENKLTLT